MTSYIDILEKVQTILCTFMKTFIGVFIYCLLVKKKITQEKPNDIPIWKLNKKLK